MSPRALPPALIALTPGTLSAEAGSLRAALRACLAAGLRGLLLREPQLEDAAYLRLTRDLAAELEGLPGAWLALHDRPHLARAAGAQAVHLGGRSLAPQQVRPWLDAHIALGLSTHAGDAAARVAECDYLLHAPFGAVPGKAPPLGRAGLQEAVQQLGRPLWALGGIAPDDVPAVLESGARGLAVLRGVFASRDPAAAVAAYLAALERGADGAPGASMRP